MSLFLSAYQSALQGDKKVGPLTGAEQQSLLFMIQAGNLYVMNWALLDCTKEDVDANEYLGYLHHHVCMIPWIEDQGQSCPDRRGNRRGMHRKSL